MTARLETNEWLRLAGFLGLAGLLGLIAGVSPQLAVAGAAAVAYVIITFTDLRIGLALFVVVTFLETTAVVPGLGLAKVAGGALALSWLAKVVSDPASRRFIWTDYPVLSAALAAFLAWGVLSAVWAPLPGAALDTSFRYLLNAALLPIVYTAVRNANDARIVVIAFVVGAAVTATLGIVSPPTGGGVDGRLTSTIGDPNEVAATLAAGFMLAIGVSFGSPVGSLSRFALRTSAALCLIALLLTLSRGGLLALIAALLLAPFLAQNRPRAAAGVLALLVTAVVMVMTLAPAGAMDRFTARDGGSGRTDIWTVATRMINENPVAGVGNGNFITSASDYVLAPGALHDKRTLSTEGSVAHNIYLEVWAELGVIGLMLFLMILLGCLGAAIGASRRALHSGDRATAALAASLALALIALMTAYFFLSEQHGNKFWIILAFCPAVSTLTLNRSRLPAAADR